MAQVIINGKAYGLRFDLGALETVETEFGDLKTVFDTLKEGTDRMSTIKRMFVIMANCQRSFDGEAEDVTVDALKRAPLSVLSQLSEAIVGAIKESMAVETANGGAADDEVHDGFLEELDAKNAKTGG